MSLTSDRPPLLDLRLFGQVEVSVCGRNVTALLPKRALWLLAILALREGKPVERQSLAGMLWPEKTDEAALHNLRQLLAHLRRTLEEAKDCIQPVSPRSLSLDCSRDIRVDACEFDRDCAGDNTSSLERAVDLYLNPLLEGCDEPFARSPREARAAAFLRAAERLATQRLSESNHKEASGILRRILAEDPYRESACRALMKAHAELGEASTALELCRNFRRKLRRDLNTDLDQETKALSREIRAGRGSNIKEGSPGKSARRRLPAPLTPLVGRASEIKSVSSLVSRCRLVTLSGAGGVGKTRLAIAVADSLGKHYLDGAWFVDLAPVQDDAVPRTIASALEIHDESSQPILETLVARLGDREMLIVLDNCEHVAEAVAHALETLLSSAPGLHVLTTSRQSIGVSGEFVWPVPPLSTPAPPTIAHEDGRAQSILESDAVRLLLERCRIDSKDYIGKAAELERMASICRRLDGLPLAIELAASRFTVLTFAEIDSKLQFHLDLLKGGSRDLPRHQTLQASIEWSWDLLSEPERRLLAQLCVFRGGCTLEAVEAVANPITDHLITRSPNGEQNVLEILTSLVDRSLVVAGGSADGKRFLLLETIRQFAHTKLEESGELEAASDRHRDYFLAFAEHGWTKMATPEEATWFEKFEMEHDNLRSAIAWCYAGRQFELALRLAAALSRFWDTCGHLSEGRQQIETALSHPTPSLNPLVRASANVSAGWMATVQKDALCAISHYQEAIPYYRESGNERSLRKSLTCLGTACMIVQDFEGAQAAWEESMELCRAAGSDSGVAMNLSNLAEMALQRDDAASARIYIEESMAVRSRRPDIIPETTAQILCALSLTDFRQGRFEEARTHAMEALRLFHDANLVVHMPVGIEHVAVAEGGLKNWHHAVRLLSACQALSARLDTPQTPLLDRDRAETLAAARKALGPARFEAAHRSGKGLGLEEAVRVALG